MDLVEISVKVSNMIVSLSGCTLGAANAADIDREQNISRAIGPFQFDAVGQAFLGKQHVDLDPRFFGEFCKQRLNQKRLAVGINVHLSGGERRAAGGHGNHAGKRTAANKFTKTFLEKLKNGKKDS